LRVTLFVENTKLAFHRGRTVWNNMGLLDRVVKKPASVNPATRSGIVAVYDSKAAPPRIINISSGSWADLIEKLTTKAYRECQQKGVSFPFVALREIIENLVHAGFKETVVSILDGGYTIRVSDQGPGIDDKGKAFEPGYTTATSQMRLYIRGVGSGLPVAREIMTFSGGTVDAKDNLRSGTVITLRLSNVGGQERLPDLTKRQLAVLSLVTEFGSAGPSDVAKELGLSLSTVHRELVFLEEMELLGPGGRGKRCATPRGLRRLNNTAVES